MRYAMAIDLDRCTGCHACSVACKVENNLPNGIWWNRIMTVGGEAMDTPEGKFPNLRMEFLPINCQHCENPACVKACPVGATYKREEDGIVIQDYDKCIGCRYCMVACPYSGVRQFNWKKPEYAIEVDMGDANVEPHQYNVVEKCTFCSHRLAQDLKPACIDTCPNRARIFGDLDDPDSDISKALKGRSYFHLLEEKGTKPAIYYLT
ncbi:MAG: 4Fe-4S dicluster domain-containing protein [Peptococcaceae bacterium]|jgi:molybdopterin-containing oxidoreductase family iron-sulfur binding subunit|nr:4Fe-4S dicluster domain-containing protein [Peptococcaceae bacterium]